MAKHCWLAGLQQQLQQQQQQQLFTPASSAPYRTKAK
jgi:hypothetical protein